MNATIATSTDALSIHYALRMNATLAQRINKAASNVAHCAAEAREDWQALQDFDSPMHRARYAASVERLDYARTALAALQARRAQRA